MFVCFVFSALLPFRVNLSLPCSGPVVSLSPRGCNIINVFMVAVNPSLQANPHANRHNCSSSSLQDKSQWVTTSLCRYPQSFPLVALFWLLYVLTTLSNPSQLGYVMWFMYVGIQFNVRDRAQKHSSHAKRHFVPDLARSSFPSAAPV